MPKSRSIAWAFIVTVSAVAATRLFPASLGVPEPSETRPNVRPSEANRSEAVIRLIADIADIGITPSKPSPARGNVAQQYYDTARVAYWSKPPDYKRAAAAYSKAAELGHPGAQNGLGWLYQNGWGVPRDIERAVYWYRHAVNQGNREAQVNLGWLYEQGWGVPRDYVEAMKLYPPRCCRRRAGRPEQHREHVPQGTWRSARSLGSGRVVQQSRGRRRSAGA